jgi:HD-like signal output (HDOD) protein
LSTWLRRLFGAADPQRAKPPSSPAPAGATPSTPGPPATLDVDVAFCQWLLDTDPLSEPAPSEVERLLLSTLDAATADEHLASRVPRVPAIVPQLLQMLRDPARSTAEVARHVSQDPVLVASVLRTANSPWYGAGRTIESVDQAVLILGHDGMRQLVAAVAFKPLINVQSGHFTRPGAPRVWEQTERAGGACRLLAPSAGASAFEAYLVTLLINVGTIVALRVLDERQPDRDAVGSRPFCTRFVFIVRDLAMQIGRQWDFPASLTSALARDAEAARAPLAVLVYACSIVSRMRMLVDAGRCARDDAVLAIGSDDRIAACFDALAPKAAIGSE